MVETALSHEQLIADIAQTVTGCGKAAFWWQGQLSFVVELPHGDHRGRHGDRGNGRGADADPR